MFASRLSLVARRPSRFISLVLAATILSGCGYHLAGEASGLPPDVQSISIGPIENHSREHGLEKSLQFALEREVHTRRQWRLEPEPSGGDAILTGRIRRVQIRPVAFNADDQATEYDIVMTLDLALKRRDDGKVLWHISGWREESEYATSAGVVVTSSSEFQQQTLDRANLEDPQLSPQFASNPQSTSIQLAETDRGTALDRLLKQTARDVYNLMVENF
ncbi:MAG TPA: LPS assembly lipoprotein LptE [Candidatus Acidoferrales bacterium]|nr:LPS assembly lipoprotein LptE [Candidatus Acidoferrales bacterium]